MKAVAPRHEHEFEPQYGLPEPLPANERLVWQGSPDWKDLARRAFHTHKLALYFGAILVLRASAVMAGGGSLSDALHAVVVLAPLFAIGLGLAALLGWLAARTCVYTLTDRRVVMRIGIVLSVTYNLPLRCIKAADLRPLDDGHGDIALTLQPGTRIAYLQLWPHARPWRLKQTQPMLRCLPGAERVALQLSQTWARANDTTLAARANPRPDSRPSASTGAQPALAGR